MFFFMWDVYFCMGAYNRHLHPMNISTYFDCKNQIVFIHIPILWYVYVFCASARIPFSFLDCLTWCEGSYARSSKLATKKGKAHSYL